MHPETEEEWMEPQPRPLPSGFKPDNWVSRCRQVILRHWHPEAIEPPEVDPELPHLTGVERSAEVFRYSVFSLEYWLSPKGYLREWLRFNAKIASILFIPALLVVPLITFTLMQFKTWAELLVTTLTGMILFPLSALLVLGLISALVYLAKSLSQRRLQQQQMQQRRDPYYYQ